MSTAGVMLWRWLCVKCMTKVYESEKHYKRDLVLRLVGLGWSVQEHEDKFCRYIPDLSFSASGKSGWIEVKYEKSPPKTLSAIKHFTKGQEQWLKLHGERGQGHCYLLVGSPGFHVVFHHSELGSVLRATKFRDFGGEKSITDLVLRMGQLISSHKAPKIKLRTESGNERN